MWRAIKQNIWDACPFRSNRVPGGVVQYSFLLVTVNGINGHSAHLDFFVMGVGLKLIKGVKCNSAGLKGGELKD